ncbi:MAG: histidine utilization repressor [Burkholderiales bacterium]|nr:histidine utilization repressor [Burkholderiales bacterium]MDE1927777.1 histidine utilization repressor [Burkholderiales bacterium]MDE2159789.1 histidine utilization repressor [Burkholderiales bacterium]MDE2502765.1 histidine utilization repressor [Burkholderiales bacterium]
MKAGKRQAGAGVEPAYRRIKNYVLAQIHAGRWIEGQAIATEEALAAQFGVARMTANRALRELSDERIVERVRGSGTFVAQRKYEATLLEIRNIADEIAARGHRHGARAHRLARVHADAAQAAAFGLAAGSALFHSLVVHFENEAPIQVEDRLVNPAVAPDYLALDLGRTTANAYLTRVAPLQGMAFRIEAALPSAEIAAMLAMAADQPCLVLHRKTLALGQVASAVTLWHPGDRYRYAGSV